MATARHSTFSIWTLTVSLTSSPLATVALTAGQPGRVLASSFRPGLETCGDVLGTDSEAKKVACLPACQKGGQ